MLAAAGLNAGLLVRGDHKLVGFQGSIVPLAGIEVENPSGLGGEIRIAREDPTAVIPRANGVLVQPAPDGASGDGGDNAGLANMPRDIGRTPVREGKAKGGRQFTSERLDLDDELWGKKSGAAPDETAPANRPGAPQRSVCATC